MDYYSERVIVLERSLGSDTNSKRLGELIHNIADGDRGALAELYKLTNKDVYAFALSILKNIHDAEDVLQDCFVRIYSSAGSYSDRGEAYGMDTYNNKKFVSEMYSLFPKTRFAFR